MKQCLLFLIAIALAGCSAFEPPQPREPHEFKVSVSADGRQIKNFEQELVHRYEIRERDVDLILASMPTRLNLPFEWATEKDSAGRIRGVRLLKRKKGYDLPDLGLKAGDLVTAGEGKLTADLRDLSLFFNVLRQNKTASFTFERGGVPHKSLFALVPSKKKR